MLDDKLKPKSIVMVARKDGADSDEMILLISLVAPARAGSILSARGDGEHVGTGDDGGYMIAQR